MTEHDSWTAPIVGGPLDGYSLTLESPAESVRLSCYWTSGTYTPVEVDGEDDQPATVVLRWHHD
ncbi:hypothetical protein [Streptomyces sp. NPDC051546]|uniref:hypothetical protein n=1 Tax=Streptomyces sp. NPDC051546 TaxID=3365655 RepID=UPI003790BB53